MIIHFDDKKIPQWTTLVERMKKEGKKIYVLPLCLEEYLKGSFSLPEPFQQLPPSEKSSNVENALKSTPKLTGLTPNLPRIESIAARCQMGEKSNEKDDK